MKIRIGDRVRILRKGFLYGKRGTVVHKVKFESVTRGRLWEVHIDPDIEILCYDTELKKVPRYRKPHNNKDTP